jgi:hypothetical protein
MELLKCIIHYVIIRSKMDQATTSLTCIAEVPGSNLGGDTNCAEIYLGFYHSVQTNTGILPHIASFHIPSSSLFSYQRYIIATDKVVR